MTNGAYQPTGPMEWLADLPEIIHTLAGNGYPIRVPDPGTEHGRALIRTLGAEIEDKA